uniref:Uncharacterized protein n=1 Tax=Wuchereria bancrofti TaxID=6293 RepID=A0A1I8EZ01_WUCBA
MPSNDVFFTPRKGETELADGGASVAEDRGTAADDNGTAWFGRSSLLCYDCYDTGPSNERCVKSKNCTGEDMLLTTAFCLLNLPNHYRKRNKINDAKCWMERDGKGKHCICSQNFCNHLRDRRIPLQGNMPLINASLTEHNPLIDYDYTSENEADFTFDLVHLEDDANVIASDPSSKGWYITNNTQK